MLVRLHRVVRGVVTLLVRLVVRGVVRRALGLTAVRVRVVLAALVRVRLVPLVVGAARRILLAGLTALFDRGTAETLLAAIVTAAEDLSTGPSARPLEEM